MESELEFAAVENYTNTTIEDVDNFYHSYSVIFTITVSIACVIGICADVTTVYMIYHFKKLRTVPNILLANWAVADIYPLVSTPLEFLAYSYLQLSYGSVSYIINYLFELKYVFYGATLIFVVLLTVDWLLASYYVNVSECFTRYYRYSIMTNWVLTIMGIGLSLILRIYNMFFMIPLLLVFFMYIFLLFFIIILQITRHIKKCKGKSSNYPTLTLTLTTAFVLLWMERWFGLVFFHFIYKYLPFLIVLSNLSFAIVFIILYRNSTDFQACFQQVWKGSDDRYVEDIPDLHIPTRNTNVDNDQIITEVRLHQNGAE